MKLVRRRGALVKDARWVALHPTKELVAFGRDGELVLGGKKLKIANLGGGAFDASGRWLVCRQAGGLTLVSVEGCEIVDAWRPRRHDFQWAVAAAGLAASGADDRIIRLWDVSRGRLDPAGTLEGHRDSVLALAFGADGRLVSGGGDRTVRVWDLERRRLVRTMRGGAQGHFGVATRGDLVASRDGAEQIFVWNLATRKETRWAMESCRDLAFSSDGKALLTICDGWLEAWSPSTSRLLASSQWKPTEALRSALAVRGSTILTAGPSARFELG